LAIPPAERREIGFVLASISAEPIPELLAGHDFTLIFRLASFSLFWNIASRKLVEVSDPGISRVHPCQAPPGERQACGRREVAAGIGFVLARTSAKLNS
jgi:hypothetical protein